MKKTLLVTALLVMLPGAAFAMECAADDVKAGKKVFKKCKACHVIKKEKNRVGPHLVGVFGRKAAVVEKYKYSKAMKKASADGLVWTQETLNEYLTAPKKYIPKNKMAFRGIKKEKKRNALLCYIKEVGGEAS